MFRLPPRLKRNDTLFPNTTLCRSGRTFAPGPARWHGRIMKRIGLLGGSFNPAHDGHRDISRFAADALALDEVWWLVSPGNPLKPRAGDRKSTRLKSSH